MRFAWSILRTVDRLLVLTLTDAAAATGMRRQQIEELLKAGSFPSAHHHGDPWVVPIADLESAGLKVSGAWLQRARRNRRRQPTHRRCTECDELATDK